MTGFLDQLGTTSCFGRVILSFGDRCYLEANFSSINC
jgi:hypothetical protein